MTTYQIIPLGNGSGFNIGVVGADGTRRTMLGFTSREAAEAWIVRDRRLTGGEFFKRSGVIAVGHLSRDPTVRPQNREPA